ncbi:MAG: hypothetical protein WKF96_13905 [Solirubrobacteraceae bacterium]
MQDAAGEIRARLQEAGFKRIGTASWEAADVELADLLRALADVLQIVKKDRRLDHLWMIRRVQADVLSDPAGQRIRKQAPERRP